MYHGYYFDFNSSSTIVSHTIPVLWEQQEMHCVQCCQKIFHKSFLFIMSCLLKNSKTSLNGLWTVFSGWSLVNFGSAFGQSLYCLYRVFRQSLDCLWNSLDGLWTVFEWSLDHGLWLVSGPSLDCFWIVSEPSLDQLCSISRPSLDRLDLLRTMLEPNLDSLWTVLGP